MRICLITYPVPHKKTQQIFFNLHRRGMTEGMGFLFAPFSPRQSRTIALHHRPAQDVGIDPVSLAKAHGLPSHTLEDYGKILSEYDIFIVAGAGLLPGEFCSSARILNAHPGLLFQSRGLDSFKWAIHDLLPVGNSLHYIDADVDAGEVVCTVPTPVYADDDLETFALRHYEAEIDMISNFDRYLDAAQPPATYPWGESHMRMPAEKEAVMIDLFEQYKEKFAQTMPLV